MVWATHANADPPKSRLEISGRHRVLHLYGTYYEMGRFQGESLRAEVRASVRMLSGINNSSNEQKMETASLRRKRWVNNLPNRYREEMRGLADGSGLPLDVVEFAQGNAYGGTQSSAMALLGSRTEGGHVLLAQSMSFTRFSEVVLVIYHPRDAYAYAMVTCPGCLDGLAGMNAKGIAITANPAPNENIEDECFPAGFLVRESLSQASTLTEATRFLERVQPADCALFLVGCGSPSNARVIERTTRLSAAFAPADPAENAPTFWPLKDCLRRSVEYANPRLGSERRFFCGFYTHAMFECARRSYLEMTRFVQSRAHGVAAGDILKWLRNLQDAERNDYQVIFHPDKLDIWLACALPGEAKESGARFQDPRLIHLRALLIDQ